MLTVLCFCLTDHNKRKVAYRVESLDIRWEERFLGGWLAESTGVEIFLKNTIFYVFPYQLTTIIKGTSRLSTVASFHLTTASMTTTPLSY